MDPRYSNTRQGGHNYFIKKLKHGLTIYPRMSMNLRSSCFCLILLGLQANTNTAGWRYSWSLVNPANCICVLSKINEPTTHRHREVSIGESGTCQCVCLLALGGVYR